MTKLLANPSTLNLIEAKTSESLGQVGRSKIKDGLAKYKQGECVHVRKLMEQA